jgi:hypothetical protein
MFMKLKSAFLILITLAMIEEMLLVSYIVSEYDVNFSIPDEFIALLGLFLSFLAINPLLLIVILALSALMLSLYFSLRIK